MQVLITVLCVETCNNSSLVECIKHDMLTEVNSWIILCWSMFQCTLWRLARVQAHCSALNDQLVGVVPVEGSMTETSQLDNLQKHNHHI